MTGATRICDVWSALARRWCTIAACAVIGALAAFIATGAVQARYRASATIYALPSQGNTLSGALRALNLGGAAGELAGRGGGADTGSYLVTVLRSHAVADSVCRSLDLAATSYGRPAHGAYVRAATRGEGRSQYALAEKLRRDITAKGDFAGLITVTAAAPSADLASDIANAYVAALDDFISTTAAGKRRFVERQLASARRDLAGLERDLQLYQATRGSYDLDTEAKQLIQNWAQFSAEAATAEVALRENAGVTQVSGSIDDLVALRSRRAGLQARADSLRQLVVKLEGRLSGLPQLGLGMARIQREVAAKQALVQTLESHLELARIAEVEDQTRFQILDRAYPPAQPSWPRRKLSAIAGALAGMALGALASTWSAAACRRPNPASGIPCRTEAPDANQS